MEIVIDIDEEIYNHMKERFMYDYAGSEFDIVGMAVRDGTPLPKGHGDLIDKSKIDMSSEYKNVSLPDNSLWIANGILNDSKVVIPADNERR